MKSILLASASIVAYAGAAAAEVTFGGSAELGYNDTNALEGQGGGEDTGFFWDADLSVTFTSELNNGLTAAASFGIDVAGTGNDNTEDDLDAVDFVLSLTSETAGLYFGNTDTAAEKHWSSAGSMASDAFSENDGDVVLRGDVIFGGVDASVSYFIYDEELVQLQVGAAAAFGNFNVAFAYQEEEADPGIGGDYSGDAVLGVSASTTLAGATVEVAYAQNSTADTDSIGVEVSYPVGPVTLGAYYVMESSENNAFGVSADYASGPISVAVNYEDTTDGEEDWSIDASYDADMFTVYAGLVDAGEDIYVAAEFPLSDNSSITVSYADDGDQDDENDIGDPEYKEGATAVLSFEF